MNREQKITQKSDDGKPRAKWANKTEYLLVVAGNVVGLGNVWRFPYLCYKYGGGAFLVPYTLLALLCGIPLFLMESAIGQYTKEGAVTCWRKLCPLAQAPCSPGLTVTIPGIQVVYFTAVFPYVMLLALLIRGVTLPGALEGIKYYLYPDLKKLATIERISVLCQPIEDPTRTEQNAKMGDAGMDEGLAMMAIS
ncbi:hypothetical protein NHX12_004304 [Muraenolepis orangiensis]|uniref:Transporter n=1 Tax=Muraenolepis orangiensis TaxID=630683 RepID=A0A9Q0IDQ6_9TELE|nr:hypothetical protein NHX12_004304 [Muraenolepis orangiensis]